MTIYFICIQVQELLLNESDFPCVRLRCDDISACVRACLRRCFLIGKSISDTTCPNWRLKTQGRKVGGVGHDGRVQGRGALRHASIFVKPRHEHTLKNTIIKVLKRS